MKSWLARTFLTLFVLFSGVLVFCNYQGAKNADRIKNYVQAQAAEKLHSKLSLSAIKLGFFDHLTLLDVTAKDLFPASWKNQIGVKSILIRYGLIELFSRRFDKPSELILKSPHIVFSSKIGSPLLWESSRGDYASFFKSITKIKIQNGRIDIAPPNKDFHMAFYQVEGEIKPFGLGKIRVNLISQSEGAFSGDLKVHGVIDLLRGTQELKVELLDINARPETRIPLQSASGKIILKENSVEIDKLSTHIQGWNSKIYGKILNFKTQPMIDIQAHFSSEQDVFDVQALADFGDHKLVGEVKTNSIEVMPFSGRLAKINEVIRLSDFDFNGTFNSSGELNLETWDYSFLFSMGSQMGVLTSNLFEDNLTVSLTLDHFKVAQLDLVSQIELKLKADRSRSGGAQNAGYHAEFETGYFILETLPFEDFEGSFFINHRGINQIFATWGQAFELSGSVLFKKDSPDLKLSIKINDFDLELIKHLDDEPLRKSFGGMLNGKVKVLGSLDQPELFADATVKQGWVGPLKYDLGIARAQGFFPYLPISDAKVMKGRTELDLYGALDFTLSNPFYGVQVRADDKIMLWNGWNLNTSEHDGDIQIGRLIDDLPALSLKAGNVHMADGEGFHDERYLTVGSKVKF